MLGKEIAIFISDLRETSDYYTNSSKSKEQKIQDSIEDHIANTIGRELGLKYPNASRKFLSDKLWEEYGISNKYFRENFKDAIQQSNKYKQ